MPTALSLLVAAVFTLGDLENAKGNISDVTVEGDVVEVFRDDIDADYGYAFLMDGNSVLPLICKLRDEELLAPPLFEASPKRFWALHDLSRTTDRAGRRVCCGQDGRR